MYTSVNILIPYEKTLQIGFSYVYDCIGLCIYIYIYIYLYIYTFIHLYGTT